MENNVVEMFFDLMFLVMREMLENQIFESEKVVRIKREDVEATLQEDLIYWFHKPEDARLPLLYLLSSVKDFNFKGLFKDFRFSGDDFEVPINYIDEKNLFLFKRFVVEHATSKVTMGISPEMVGKEFIRAYTFWKINETFGHIVSDNFDFIYSKAVLRARKEGKGEETGFSYALDYADLVNRLFE